jgi:hypothetical protein
MDSPIDSALRGRRVEALRGGVRLTVELSGRLVLTVENDFRLHHADEVEHFYPGLGTVPTGPLSALVGARVDTVTVSPAGSLDLRFDSGLALSVPPDTTGPAEAWRISGPTGPLFAAQPGGYLTISQP